jgi:hypothetical protein
MPKPSLQLIGKSFGRLTVTGKANKPSYWDCTCECDRVTQVRGTYLVQGKTASCGCLRTSHGHCKDGKRSPEYTVWATMKARCDAGTDPAYRDIRYDPLWADFQAFYADVGDRPKGTTLDRIDAAGDYTKENTRWADRFTQANNKKKYTVLSFNIRYSGREGTAAEWARWLRLTTGDPDWTVRQLKSCLKVMSIDQIMLGVHPAGIDVQELTERSEFDRLIGMPGLSLTQNRT